MRYAVFSFRGVTGVKVVVVDENSTLRFPKGRTKRKFPATAVVVVEVSRRCARGFRKEGTCLGAYERLPGNELDQCHEAAHLLSQPPSTPTDIDTIDMDDIRESFSKLKKGLKHRVGGKKRAPDRAGDSTAGERVSSSVSLQRPDPRTAVSGHDGEGGATNANVSQARSRDPSPRPEPVPADEGRLDNPQKKEVDVGEKEASRRRSSLDADVEGTAGSNPGQEVERASSPPPVTSIPRKQEHDSTRTLSPQPTKLIIPSDDTDRPAVRDHTPQEVRPDENAEPGVAANERKSGWKSTAFATAKLLLQGVRDSADAFGPLKSVAGGICFIVENYEVWSSPCIHYQSSYTYLSE